MKEFYQKVDKASLLIEEMFLMNAIHDEKKFKEAHNKAGKLLFDALRLMEEHPSFDGWD